MSRGLGRNSPTQCVEMMKCVNDKVEIPANVRFNREERAIWQDYASAKVAEDWRAVDLALLVKVVRLESKMRQLDAMIEEQGITVLNASGTPILNPVFLARNLCQREQMVLIRALHITQAGNNVGHMKAKAIQATEYAKIEDAADKFKVRDS